MGEAPLMNRARTDALHGSPSFFEDELAETLHLLHESLADLYPPLSEVAHFHLQRVQPPLRAAAVIAAGVGAQEGVNQRSQRVALAAALEMQSIALSIHRVLLDNASDDSSLDKSLMGSTILTGDYCFSRAAVLATYAESPAVVAVFSQTLRDISEGHLRRLLSSDPGGFDEDLELMMAGVRGVAHVVDLNETAIQIAEAYVTAALAWVRYGAPLPSIPTGQLSLLQAARWQAFVAWLTGLQNAAHAG